MERCTGDVPGMSVFNESKGYIAYDIPDNVRGMEILTIGVTTDMQMMIDPSVQISVHPHEAGSCPRITTFTFSKGQELNI